MRETAAVSIFQGKVAVITGAGSGIGKSLAEELARRGARVVISDINSGRIENTAEGIARSGGKVTAATLDVSDYEAVKSMVEGTLATHGRIDYLFNNAGIAIAGPAKEFTIEDWRRVMDINLYGVVHGIAVAYPLMVKQGWGHIVNTASIEGLVPFPATVSYVASKYAVVGLSSALRIEGAAHGVRVSVVCPGYVRTAIFADSKIIGMDRQNIKGLIDRLGVTPEECARIILGGVERNEATIIVTFYAKFLCFINRLIPGLWVWLMARNYRKAVENGMIR